MTDLSQLTRRLESFGVYDTLGVSPLGDSTRSLAPASHSPVFSLATLPPEIKADIVGELDEDNSPGSLGHENMFRYLARVNKEFATCLEGKCWLC
jgi:hypothetical protein